MNRSPLVIIGFGNQAKTWALNLRDSAREVTIALRKEGSSSSHQRAHEWGFPTLSLGTKEMGQFTQFALLTPDHTHSQVLENNASFLPPGSTLIYAHGQSVHKFELHKSYPSFSHLLLAPKSIASEMRSHYLSQGKIGALYSVEHSLNPSQDQEFLLNLAKDLGINVGPFPSSFQNETYADLFSEQTLLCSLLPYMALFSYNLLVKKGIEKELAFLECWHELKLIANTMVDLGPQEFFKMISPMALLGSRKGLMTLFDQDFQKKMEGLWEDIAQKKFYDQCEGVDYDEVRKEVLQLWEQGDFLQTFAKLSPQLYS